MELQQAKWSYYIVLTNKSSKTLLPLNSLDVIAAYIIGFGLDIGRLKHHQESSQKTIPRGYRNNYIPCCKSLNSTFLQPPQRDDSSLAARALLAKLDRKWRDR